MTQHRLKFQATIPAHLTRSPQKALARVIEGAVEHLNSLAPRATRKSFTPMYEERVTPIGTVWDLLVIFSFDYPGPLPPDVSRLKQHHDITLQLRRNRA